MLFNEARWLAERLGEFDVEMISPMIDFGSANLSFRETGQPFITNLIFRSIEQRGVDVIHVDLVDGEGIDIAGNIFDEAVYAKICSYDPCAVLCANVLEHVRDPGCLARLCVEMVPNGGLIFVTVPYSFPFHPSPIDTMYRPGPEELSKIFPECKMFVSEIVKCETFGKQLYKSTKILSKHLFHLLIPWPTVHHWKSALHKNLWIFKNYQVTCAVFEKRG